MTRIFKNPFEGTPKEEALPELPKEFRVPDDCKVMWLAETKKKGTYGTDKGQLTTDKEKALKWGTRESCDRWCKDYAGGEFRSAAHIFKK